MEEPVIEEIIWQEAGDLLEKIIDAGLWSDPDPDDPDSWGLARERVAYALLYQKRSGKLTGISGVLEALSQ